MPGGRIDSRSCKFNEMECKGWYRKGAGGCDFALFVERQIAFLLPDPEHRTFNIEF